MFMVQNVVEFELWQLDRIGGNTGRRRLQGLGGGGREHRDMRGLGLQDATGPTC